MNTPTQQPQTITQQPKPTYQTPRVTDLGAWQAVTLIYSVPINPASPAQMLNPNGGNNGY